jgi:sec-independent protein translocase protein TatA
VNLGSTEILLIVLVILLLFGPSQIPKMARGFGQAIREFKKAQREISDELEREPPAQPQPPKSNSENQLIN